MDPNATPAPPAPPPAPPAPEPQAGGGGLTSDDIQAAMTGMIPAMVNAMIGALAQHGGAAPPEAAAAPPEAAALEPPPEEMGEDEDLGDEGLGAEPPPDDLGPDEFPEDEFGGDLEDEDEFDDEDPDLYCEEGAMSAPSGTNTAVPGAAKRRPRSDQYARGNNGDGKPATNGKPDRYARLKRDLDAERTARKKLEEEVEAMRLDRYFRDRQEVFNDLARDYDFDPAEELESTATFSDEAFKHHVEQRIPNRYQKRDPENNLREPDNVDFPAGAGPDRNARSGGPDRGARPALTEKQFSAVQKYSAENNGLGFVKSIKAVREEQPELFG